MRRFSLWLRERPLVGDGLIAAFFFGLDLLGMGQSRAKVLFLLMSVVICAPIVLRRRYPKTAALLVLAASMATTVVVHTFDNHEVTHLATLLLLVALYTLVVYVGRIPAAIFALGLLVDLALSILLLDLEMPVTALFGLLLYTIAWLSAEFLAARHKYHEEMAARLRIAELDRDRRAEEAVATERTRIARELHDVVAHAVSVMIVQADGAAYALRSNPDLAHQALGNISAQGRQALAELRRTVALLRTEQTPAEMPQHGTAGLSKLVQMLRDAGLVVELELKGDLDALPPTLSMGVHRIVQESLTNALRHAGQGAVAAVRVHRRDSDVLVVVTDSGGVGDPTYAHGSGNGLVGMRERVAVLGGTIAVGPQPDGTWRVRAEIPVP